MGRSHGCYHWSHECYRCMEANRSHGCYQWSHGCYNSMGAALQDDSGLEGLFACARETQRADYPNSCGRFHRVTSGLCLIAHFVLPVNHLQSRP